MELTEERVREIVREEVSQMRDEYRKAHTWDKFEEYLEKNLSSLCSPTHDKRADE